VSQPGRVGWVAAFLVLGVAGWLRFDNLGTWSLDGDEVYSWFDVQKMLAGGPWPNGARSHPLGYLLILLFVSVFGLTEFVVRSGSAVCGFLAVVALLRMRRDVLSPRVAVAASVLAALSPWLIYHAQTARFYAPLLLCATLATLWALPGPGRRPLASTVAWVFAVLCHPTALLLGPGLVAPLFLPSVRWRLLAGTGLAVSAALAVAWLLDDGALEQVVMRVYEGLDPGSYSLPHLVNGLGYALGPILGLLALLGLPGAWADRRGLGVVLLVSASVPPALLLGASLAGLSMHQRYAMCAVPAVLLLAGRGWEATWRRKPALAWVVATAAVVAYVPQLAAYAQDGNRHDVRGVAAFLVQNAQPEDVIVADEHAALEVYLHGQAGFADTVIIEESQIDAKKRHDFLRNRSETWVAVKLSRLGSAYGSEFTQWLAEFFTEVQKVGAVHPPLVRHDNRYVIYRRTSRIHPRTGHPMPPRRR
jgi:4-amino-4-deoxy-L-arabinose transferase-like glycosyltransferase